MKNPVLAENNWKTIRDSKIDLVVLPWGATEAHNLHLPYATDNFQVEALAIESAKLANEQGNHVVVLPTIPFGVNTGQAAIKLTINLNPSTQSMILKDIAERLNRQGIYKLLIMNGHGGNDFKQLIREVNHQFPNMLIATCNWFQSFERSRFFAEPGEHADEAETSLMMYLKPKLVLPLVEAGDGASKNFKVEALNEKWAWAERQWDQISEDTGVGYPKNASAEKGEACFNYLIEKISKLMTELVNLDLQNPYQ